MGSKERRDCFQGLLDQFKALIHFLRNSPGPLNAFPRRQHQGALILAPYCLVHTVRQPEWRAGWEYAPTPSLEGREGRKFAVAVLNRCSKCKCCSCQEHALFFLPSTPSGASHKELMKRETVSKAIEQTLSAWSLPRPLVTAESRQNGKLSLPPQRIFSSTLLVLTHLMKWLPRQR